MFNGNSSVSVAASTSSSESDEEKVVQEGSLHEHIVKKTPELTSKWWAVAIAVGLLLVIGSGFGIVGLLQTYQLLSLPPSLHWLASAIGTIGQALPSNGGLWMIAIFGGIAGVISTAAGSWKVHQRRIENQQLEERKESEKQLFLNAHFSEAAPGSFFTDKPIPSGSYYSWPIDEKQCIVLMHEKLTVTEDLSSQQAQEYITQLKSYGFKDLLETVNFSQFFSWGDSIYNYLEPNTYAVQAEEGSAHFKIIRKTAKGRLEISKEIPEEHKSAFLAYLESFHHYQQISPASLTAVKETLEKLKPFGYTTQIPEGIDKESLAKLQVYCSSEFQYIDKELHLKSASIVRASNEAGGLICKSNIEPSEYRREFNALTAILTALPATTPLELFLARFKHAFTSYH